MAAHRRHRRHESSKRNEPAPGAAGLNLGTLTSILGNIDITQLASILGTVGTILPQVTGSPGERQSSTGGALTPEGKEELVKALQVIISSDKSELLQVMLQMLSARKGEQNQGQ